MKILLPNYNMVIGDSAEVRDDKLYLYKIGDFDDVMYMLTYEIFGKDECYYCHRKLRQHETQCNNNLYFSRISIEHLIPQFFGGPTITNNMRPACTACNSRKSNMFEDEYYMYLRLLRIAKTTGDATLLERFKEELLVKQEKRKKGEIASLPAEWTEDRDINSIWVQYRIGQKKGDSYKKTLAEAIQYGFLIKPMLITANNVLVDGFNANLVATFLDIPRIIIPMDNVIQCGYGDKIIA